MQDTKTRLMDLCHGRQPPSPAVVPSNNNLGRSPRAPPNRELSTENVNGSASILSSTPLQNDKNEFAPTVVSEFISMLSDFIARKHNLSAEAVQTSLLSPESTLRRHKLINVSQASPQSSESTPQPSRTSSQAAEALSFSQHQLSSESSPESSEGTRTAGGTSKSRTQESQEPETSLPSETRHQHAPSFPLRIKKSSMRCNSPSTSSSWNNRGPSMSAVWQLGYQILHHIDDSMLKPISVFLRHQMEDKC